MTRIREIIIVINIQCFFSYTTRYLYTTALITIEKFQKKIVMWLCVQFIFGLQAKSGVWVKCEITAIRPIRKIIRIQFLKK